MNSDLPVVLYGGGDQGRIAHDALLALGREVAGVVDNIQPANFPVPWLGDEERALKSHRTRPWHVSIGVNDARDDILKRLADQLDLSPLTLVHPAAEIGSGVNLGPGTFVAARAIVAHSARLGPGCLVNHAATVDHDCVLERGVHIAPGCHLAGRVRVGERTLLGVGAVVIPGVQIGKNCIIGAGSVVIRDISDGSRVVGNPAVGI